MKQATLIGSSSETSVGVGTLLHFTLDQISEVTTFENNETEAEYGRYRVTKKDGEIYWLTDLVLLKASELTVHQFDEVAADIRQCSCPQR